MTSEVRPVLRSPAVESFLRNFESERARLAEVLELALCYGVCCLAHNFSLKGMSVAELRVVTQYDKVRKRDFFVRNAGSSAHRKPHAAAVAEAAQSVRQKPPHSWRDGNADAEILEFPISYGAADNGHQDARGVEASAATAAVDTAGKSSVQEAVESAKPLDEIDYFASLFGKQFVDAAWAVFAGTQLPTRPALEVQFVRLDQRTVPGRFPACELPVASFAVFLGEYVKRCVSQRQHPVPDDAHVDKVVSAPVSAVSTAPDATKHSRAPRTAPTRVAAVQSARAAPKALAHVRSTLKPELDARREKLLRVKKTQTQLMKESLARTRLAEYEAKRMLDAAGYRRSGSGCELSRKMPLADITTGAAALEIADGFMTSPLLGSFGGKENEGDRRVDTRARNDSLREELYGAAALDDSFLGCKTPPRRREQRPTTTTTKPSRRYNGWLGDFGPQHTKTVVTEWGAPDDDDDNDDDDDSDTESKKNRPQLSRQGNRRSPSVSKKLEWQPGDGPTDSSRRRGSSRGAAPQKHSAYVVSSAASDGADDDDVSDTFSDDGASEASDPVFRWLKRTV
ncbi:hypothetical protein PybrP1_011167 [[Pythium] brassicae (nom. inval.)]|nr:hypothetical protein PybrP1_011167 [[Pythium] brassicae (nom. inval.)]